MDFYEHIHPDIDIHKFGEGWLVNGLFHLNKDITEDDVKNFRLSLLGCLAVDVDDRDMLVYYTDRFHLVKKMTIECGPCKGSIVCRCSCADYYQRKRCFPSLYFQHRDFLETKGQTLPGAGRKKKVTETQKHMGAIQKVKKRKQERAAAQKVNAKTTSVKLVQPLPVTQDDPD
jgi:hypothetical protein